MIRAWYAARERTDMRAHRRADRRTSIRTSPAGWDNLSTSRQCFAAAPQRCCRAVTADLPNEGELGTDQSRSDATLLCDVPSIVGGRYGYCCFTPTQLTLGGTCLQDQAVPNCASGSFGFACTGPDTPEQDYPRIMCSTPSVPGTSAQGYRANLYCCDYLSLGE